MGIHWTSLFISSAESLSATTVADDVLTALIGDGYQSYNPFGLMPGKTYRDSIRLFVAPPQQQVLRILSDNPELSPTVLTSVTKNRTGVFCHLNARDAHMVTYQDGMALLGEDVAMQGSAQQERESQPDEVAWLPEQYQSMAKHVDATRAQNMIGRFAGEIMGKAGGDLDAAQALLQSSQPIDWATPHAQQLTASVNRVLGFTTWQTPEFATLRDAYSLYMRRERKPDARLLPGDEAIMQAVPNALDYIPIYVGK